MSTFSSLFGDRHRTKRWRRRLPATFSGTKVSAQIVLLGGILLLAGKGLFSYNGTEDDFIVSFYGFVDERFHSPCINLFTSSRVSQRVNIIHTHQFVGETVENRRLQAVQSVLDKSTVGPKREMFIFLTMDHFAFLRQASNQIFFHLYQRSVHSKIIFVPESTVDVDFSLAGASLFAGSFEGLQRVINLLKKEQSVSRQVVVGTMELKCSPQEMLKADTGYHSCEKVPLLEVINAPKLSDAIHSWLNTGSRYKRSMEALSLTYSDEPNLFRSCGEASHTLFASLPVYYINMKSSRRRRKGMESMLAGLSAELGPTYHVNPFRIEAVTAEVAENLVHRKHIKIPSDIHYGRESKLGKIYSFRELACLLSHFKALDEAYHANHEVALIIEDDAVLEPEFFRVLPSTLADAPEDWEVIQLFTLAPGVVRRFPTLRYTKFIHWFPSHWSTTAYLVNRKALKKIHDTFLFDGTVHLYKGLRTSVADEVVYLRLKTYTCTLNAVTVDEVLYESTVQKATFKPHIANAAYRDSSIHRKVLPSAVPSVLIFVTERVNSAKGFIVIMQILVQNMKSLRTFDFEPHWVVHFVLPDDEILETIDKIFKQQMVESAVFNLEVKFEIRSERYNKFSLLQNELDSIDKYDVFVMVDGDFDLSGLGWLETMTYLSKAVVLGSVNENVEEQLSFNHGVHRQYYRIFDGAWWRENIPDIVVDAVEIPFIEQGFAMMDAKFASWFFRQILKKKYLGKVGSNYEYKEFKSDFGPDLMWCGAANEWLSGQFGAAHTYRKIPCALILKTSIKHVDTRQITETSYEASKQTQEEVSRMEREPLKKYRADYKRWFEYSRVFLNEVSGKNHITATWLQKMIKHPITMEEME